MNADSDRTIPAYSMTVRRIIVGGLTKAELREQFQKHTISMNAQDEALFAALPETNAESSNIETVELAVQQLGFPEGATSVELFDQAVKRRLTLCPLRVAPHLRLQ